MGAGLSHDGGPVPQRLPRSRRITRSEEIRALMRRGKRSRMAHVDVIVSASPAAHPRVGVVVPRYGRTIVERNLLKRRLREILRRDVLTRLGRDRLSADFLVRARAEAYGAEFVVLRNELLEALERVWPQRS